MANLKAVELIARPPLTDIAERLSILGNELPKDRTAVIVVSYPHGEVYLFGEALSQYEVMGLMYDAANTFKPGSHT
jgi:hypothetical protein